MTAASILQSAQNIADTNCQPAPKPSANPAVWSLVMRDMTERDIFGAEKYGVRLQPGNGRDFLVDAYQEALDLVAYLRGAIYERDQLATADKFAAMQSELPDSFGQQNMIDPADVEIVEDPLACSGCMSGCYRCCPGLGKIAAEKLERMRANPVHHASFVEVASDIDDESPRADAIGQNGNTGEHYDDPWAGAPEWAKYAVMQDCGEWRYYEFRPALIDCVLFKR